MQQSRDMFSVLIPLFFIIFPTSSLGFLSADMSLYFFRTTNLFIFFDKDTNITGVSGNRRQFRD